MKWRKNIWEIAELNKTVFVVNGSTPKGIETANNSGEFPFLRVSDMNLEGNEIYINNSNISLSKADIDKFKVKLYPKNTIIFPKRGASIYTNKKRILQTDSGIDLNTMGFIAGDKIDFYYLYIWFQTIDLKTISDGSYVPQINSRNIEGIQILLPPLEEQKQIADLFQSIETAIEQVEGQEKNLKLLRQKLIDSLCEKGESISKAFKMSEWQKCKIEDIAYWYQRDISNDKQAENGIEVYICADHIESSEILISRNGKLDDGKKGPTITKHFREGDFLFSTRSVSLHKAAVAQVSGVTGEKLIVIDVLASSKIIKGFLPYIMHSSKFWSFAKVTASGSVNKFSSWNKIKQYEFFLPPLNEQQKFIELFQQLEDLLEQLKQQKTTLKNLKQKLLNEILG